MPEYEVKNGPFIFWDGEACLDTGYCLFGCSVAGTKPDGTTFLRAPFLGSMEMLDHMLGIAESNPDSPHVAFAFDYDVNNIIHEMDWRHLTTLRAKGKVNWNGYQIEHIPGKIFKVSKDGRHIRVDDVFSYFRSRFDKALVKYDVGDQRQVAEISSGKDNRSDFWWKDIPNIESYWALEVTYGCDLMEKIRKMAHRAGYFPAQWYGPGALAAYSLKQNKVVNLMCTSNAKIHAASLSAYAGGWFERYKMGFHDGPAYTADINSAYVYAMSLLPDLRKGNWEYIRRPSKELARSVRFGLFHVNWSPDFDLYMRACHGLPLPLFHRDPNNSIHRPTQKTSVWLWNPEAANTTIFSHAEFKEAWIYHDDGSYPFSWVSDMYNLRLALQAENDPAEKILKWTMASYYGRLAQRTGWDEKNRCAPKFHQIEWAGWITSKCRSMVYRAAFEACKTNSLVSVDTDGIISTHPFENLENGEGNQLGRWKVEKFDGLIYLQNGVYWLRDNGTWLDPKLRGIPRTKLDPETGMQALRNGGVLALDRRTFVGYGAALHRDRKEWLQWVDRPVKINAQQCGSRIHVPQMCRPCKAGFTISESLHDLTVLPHKGTVSKPHQLPWLDPKSAEQRTPEDWEQVMLF